MRIRLASLVVCLALAWAGSAFAQGAATTSTISGVVVDSAGGVVPGADVTIKHTATGVSQSAISNAQGAYLFPSLPIGTYTLTVTLQGFKTFVANDVVLTAGSPASVRAVLEVGGIEEQVLVSSRSEIVQTQSTVVSSTINASQIMKLPNTSRARARLRDVAARRDDGWWKPAVADQRLAAGGDQHHARRRERAGQHAAQHRRLLRDRQSASRFRRRSHGDDGDPGSQRRSRCRADQIRDALGRQRLHGQRLLVLSERQAQREQLVQQPWRRGQDPAQAEPGRRARWWSDRHSGVVRRPEQGVLLLQLRGVPSARRDETGTATC